MKVTFVICSVTDAVRYVSVKELQDSVFNILPIFIRQWEIQMHWVHTPLATCQREYTAEYVKTY